VHHHTLAGPRRRTWRALLAAALPAVVAAVALPAGASASVLENDPNAASGLRLLANQETNTVTVRDIANGSGLEIADMNGLTERSGLCAPASITVVRCARPTELTLDLGDRNDRATISTSLPVVARGGLGADTFIAEGGLAASRVRYSGGSEFDRISYANADRGVAISNDRLANDGRKGLDRDNVQDDIEQLGGSRFDDQILDGGIAAGRTELIGGPGADVLGGGRGPGITHFKMGPFADGADTIVGNGQFAELDYSLRSRPVTATVDFNGADDGEAGEGDEIKGVHGYVAGGQAGDTLRARPGSTAFAFLDGQGGNDTLEGAEGNDLIYAFAGEDTVLARGGDDVIRANDGVFDAIACGNGDDIANVDSRDGTASCETHQRVGELRLTPRRVRAEVGETSRLRLSWRHPEAWRKLRTVQLRLTQGALPDATVTIHPRRARIAAGGAVRLVRRGTRLTRDGKTVTAQLALRLDESLAGRTLKAEVEATDRRGRRQLERDAGTVRVAG
jgi:hypothetical protein